MRKRTNKIRIERRLTRQENTDNEIVTEMGKRAKPIIGKLKRYAVDSEMETLSSYVISNSLYP